MKKLRFLLPAVFALVAIVPAQAQTVIGAWSFGDPSVANGDSGALIFLPNGYYFHVQDTSAASGPSGFDGFERGSYTWNSGTGAISVIALQDTNGDIGMSSIYSGALFNVSGDILTATNADGPGIGTFQLDRVTGADAIIGAWSFGDPSVADGDSGALIFLPNGYYFHVQDTSAASGPSGFDGFERGSYTWNPGTGAISVIALQDTNGDIGMSSIYSGALVNVSGDILTATNFDGPGIGTYQLDRVTAVPEPSSYALTGIGVLWLAVWGRRRRTGAC